ncbi:S41 family peptidase [Parvularcula maris]|uniref:S41 family peptidase n=1 Tax=Parvularcula maris TaxID=2965077 RepID=A0A9X2RL14_9PROT|nr:S41 family peptidase [Parvularcula maris]MCQ8186122.1 S41 family peptidase [Parvularcula maris]
MTGLLNDVHVTVRDTEEGRFARSGGRSIGTGPFDTEVFSLPLIEQRYAVGGLELLASGPMRLGELPGNIGYLHIESFRYPTTTEAALGRIAGAMKGRSAVIVDVRQNGGGADQVARLLAGLFADKSRVVMTAQERGLGEITLGDPVPWRIERAEDALTQPVFLLTNDRTISAAENFALMMRAFPPGHHHRPDHSRSPGGHLPRGRGQRLGVRCADQYPSRRARPLMGGSRRDTEHLGREQRRGDCRRAGRSLGPSTAHRVGHGG